MLIEPIPVVPTGQFFGDLIGATRQLSLHRTNLTTDLAQGHVRGAEHEDPVCHVATKNFHGRRIEIVSIGPENLGIEKDVSRFEADRISFIACFGHFIFSTSGHPIRDFPPVPSFARSSCYSAC